jgi:hypothetical protein
MGYSEKITPATDHFAGADCLWTVTGAALAGRKVNRCAHDGNVHLPGDQVLGAKCYG